MRLPSLSIDSLAAFIALAQQRNFELAGRKLHISGSAVHKRLRAAERSLGCRLFLFSTEGIRPTREGEVLYPDALRIVEHASLAEQKVKAFSDLDASRISLGHSTYLAPSLLAFIMRLESAALAKLRIEHSSGLTPTLIQRVVDGTLHAAFGELSAAPASLLVRQLLEEPILVCLPKEHRLATNRVVRPQDLEGERIIAVSRDHLPQQHSEVEDLLTQFGVQTRIAADAFGPSEALVLTAQQIGISFLPASLVSGPPVVARPLSVRTLTRKSGLYIREDNRHQIITSLTNLALHRPDPKASRAASSRQTTAVED
jgi:LysR family hca operon transcriptional activator